MNEVYQNTDFGSKFIQLSSNTNHFGIYQIGVDYFEENGEPTNKIKSATVIDSYPIYIHEDYNFYDLIREDWENRIISDDCPLFIMEENENDEPVNLLGMIFISEKEGTDDEEEEADIFIDMAEWDYRVIATQAFDKDFVYPISEHRSQEE